MVLKKSGFERRRTGLEVDLNSIPHCATELTRSGIERRAGLEEATASKKT
jgi:hypothetical protein